jgi:PAS domain S-box-containing protein
MKKQTGKTGKKPSNAATRAELEDSAAIALALFESDAQGIAIVDKRGLIERANPKLAQMFGYDSGQLVGQSIEMLVPERLRGAHVSHRDNYFKSPRTRPMGLGLSGDLFGRRKDGTEFPIDVSLSSFESAHGRLAMAFITEIFWDPI